MKSTGWKEHSCRAFLTGVRKTSKLLKEQRSDGKTAYRIDARKQKARRMTALEQQLAELPGMSPAQLRAKWRECWRKPAPDIGPDLLRRGIAWKLQSRMHGDLPQPHQARAGASSRAPAARRGTDQFEPTVAQTGHSAGAPVAGQGAPCARAR